MDCSAVDNCTQAIVDGLFTLKFAPTDTLSGPSPKGYIVHAPSIEILNANCGLMSLGVLTATILSTSNNFNMGTVQLEVQRADGSCKTMTQWTRYVGLGFYVLFDGHQPSIRQKITGPKGPVFVSVL